MIPNLSTTATPGRGGSDLAGQGGEGGASHCQTEISTQRDLPPVLFEHGETELATATGIAAKVLQKIRQKKLRRGFDWELSSDLRVAYSRPGIVRLLELASGSQVQEGAIAGVALGDLEERTRISGQAPAAAATPPEELVSATVFKLFPNPHLIEVILDGGQHKLVRVRESKNFRRGMEVPLRLKPEAKPDGFELARRLPRFPGKW